MDWINPRAARSKHRLHTVHEVCLRESSVGYKMMKYDHVLSEICGFLVWCVSFQPARSFIWSHIFLVWGILHALEEQSHSFSFIKQKPSFMWFCFYQVLLYHSHSSLIVLCYCKLKQTNAPAFTWCYKQSVFPLHEETLKDTALTSQWGNPSAASRGKFLTGLLGEPGWEPKGS